MHKLLFILTIISGTTAIADNTINPALAEALPQITSDFEPLNQSLLAVIQDIVASPPTTDEEIGVYGAEDLPANIRAIQAAIRHWGDNEVIMGFEDKYIYEMVDVWGQNGLLPEAKARALTQSFLGDIEAELDFDIREDEENAASYFAGLKERFPQFTQEVEQAFIDQEKRLLQIQVPLGDTLFFVVTSPDVADKWAGTLLATYEEGGVQEKLAITEPVWVEYWSMLVYALQFPYEMDTTGPDLPVQKLVAIDKR